MHWFHFRCFNKLVILERRETQFAQAKNQSLADGIGEGIFEGLRQAFYFGTTSSLGRGDWTGHDAPEARSRTISEASRTTMGHTVGGPS